MWTTYLNVFYHGIWKDVVVFQMVEELLRQNDILDEQTMISSDDFPLSHIHSCRLLAAVVCLRSYHLSQHSPAHHKSIVCSDLIRVIGDTGLSSSKFLTKFSIVKYI